MTTSLRQHFYILTIALLFTACNQSGSTTAKNIPIELTGKFVVKDADCAGLNFINDSLASWTNEIDCGHPDTLRLRWTDGITFFTQDIRRISENCPPRISIYQVATFDGQHLTLKEIWTGWNNHNDELIEFTKVTDDN